MRIIADESIPFVREAFAEFGDVVTLPGRAICHKALHHADVLLVRSITKVNEALLGDSPVRFVATATIGVDHIDVPYLQTRNIGFSAAPGSNANSVAEYIVAASLDWAEETNSNLRENSLGIIGVGNVGSRVATKAKALGMKCVLNDPPLARCTGDSRYRPIKDVLDCDIVTVHTPLTHAGPDATFHMVNKAFLSALKPGALLLNTARGGVADTAALTEAIEQGRIGACVLDVWENEPTISTRLLELVFLGTPHIAGYSLEGKVNGTQQIYDAACAYFERVPVWQVDALLPEPEHPYLTVDSAHEAVSTIYSIKEDDIALREILRIPTTQHAAFFDSLRTNYRRRREFGNTRVMGPPKLVEMLQNVGFGR